MDIFVSLLNDLKKEHFGDVYILLRNGEKIQGSIEEVYDEVVVIKEEIGTTRSGDKPETKIHHIRIGEIIDVYYIGESKLFAKKKTRVFFKKPKGL